jgi:hypothetical protein
MSLDAAASGLMDRKETPMDCRMAVETATQGRRMICVTPTRNESWVIKPFIAAAKTWADRVIVADQGSDDGTFEALQQVEKVIPVRNESKTFDEQHRQRLLLENARRVEGTRILIGLDADEAFSANCTETGDWKRMLEAAPGTVLTFRWANVLPGFEKVWIPGARNACGFVDDGSPHQGRAIHSPRVPRPDGAPVLDIQDFVILHFQYVSWERMRRKHRWYQTWEYLNNWQNRPLDIFRLYNHMHGSWEEQEIEPMQDDWMKGYDRAGIDFRSLKSEPVTWWDKELVKLLGEHGPQRFRRLDIWDQDWNAMAERIGVRTRDLSDPRSAAEKAIHKMLGATQKRRSNPAVRALEYVLRRTGW